MHPEDLQSYSAVAWRAEARSKPGRLLLSQIIHEAMKLEIFYREVCGLRHGWEVFTIGGLAAVANIVVRSGDHDEQLRLAPVILVASEVLIFNDLSSTHPPEVRQRTPMSRDAGQHQLVSFTKRYGGQT